MDRRWEDWGVMGIVGGLVGRTDEGGSESGLDLYVGELKPPFRAPDVGGYLATAVDNCGVVAIAQEVADLLEGELSVLTQEIHGKVACFRGGFGTAESGKSRR